MIFITGATGLLGAHFLVELSQKNEAIRALKRKTSNLNQVQSIFQFYFGEEGKAKFESIEWVEGDVLDIPSLDEAMKGCKAVYHCAAMVSFRRWDFRKMMEINKTGTANIVNLALSHNIDHLVYISSVAALGRDGRKGFYDENNKWKPSDENTGYAISKYSAENEVWRGVEEGLNVVILNPTIILGPGNWNESSVTFFKMLHKGMLFYPPGENGFVDARDVAKIGVELATKEIFNQRYLTVGENASFLKLFTHITNSFGKKPPRFKLQSWMLAIAWRLDTFLSLFGKKQSITKENSKSSFGVSKYSNDKVKNELGYKFYSLEETVENASNYFKSFYLNK